MCYNIDNNSDVVNTHTNDDHDDDDDQDDDENSDKESRVLCVIFSSIL